jgi:hypothetical protein
MGSAANQQAEQLVATRTAGANAWACRKLLLLLDCAPILIIRGRELNNFDHDQQRAVGLNVATVVDHVQRHEGLPAGVLFASLREHTIQHGLHKGVLRGGGDTEHEVEGDVLLQGLRLLQKY